MGCGWRTCSHALSECGRGGFASFPARLGGAHERDGRLGVAGRRWMGALRGAGPPPHRTDSSQTAATRPPTLGRSGQIAASLGLAAVNHISRREASLAARVAGSDAPARGGWRRPHGDRGGADGDGGRRKRQECEWAWPGAVAQNGRASRWSKPRARASVAALRNSDRGGRRKRGRVGGGGGREGEFSLILSERAVKPIVGEHRNLISGRAIEVKVGACFWAMLRLEGASTGCPDEQRPSARVWSPRFRCGAATGAGPSAAVAVRRLRADTDHVAQDPAAILLVRGLALPSRRARRWPACAADGWGRMGRGSSGPPPPSAAAAVVAGAGCECPLPHSATHSHPSPVISPPPPSPQTFKCFEYSKAGYTGHICTHSSSFHRRRPHWQTLFAKHVHLLHNKTS